MTPTILVTRPIADAQALAHQLEQASFSSVIFPTLEIIPVVSQANKQSVMNIDHYACVIVTSKHAASQLLALLDAYWPQLPEGILWVAVGATTAQVLQEYGLEVETPEHESTEGVLALLEGSSCLATWQQQGKPVLIVKGKDGRPDLAEQLALHSLRVETVDTYERVCPHYECVDADFIHQKGFNAAVFTSVACAENCLRIFEQLHLDIHMLKRAPCFVPGERVAKVLAQQQFEQVVNVGAAQNQKIVTAVKHFYKK